MSDENTALDGAIDEAVESSAEENQELELVGNDESADVEASADEGVQAETAEELQAEVEEAIEAGASEQEVKNMIKEFQLKVGGKTYTKKLDLNNEEELQRELQMAMAGRQAMQQKAELEKIYEQEIRRLQDNPWEVLQELGFDPLELSESKLREFVEEQQKSPEQLERERIERELIQARQEAEDLKRRQEEMEFAKLQEQAAVELESEIQEALDAHTTLPRSPKTVMRIADALLWANDNGFPDARVTDVLPMVEDDIKREMQDFFNMLPEDMFEAYINQQNLERYRKSRIPKKKAPNNVNNIKPTSDSIKKESEEKKEVKKMSAKDFFRNLK